MNTEEYFKLQQIEFQNAKIETSFEKQAFFYIHHLKGFWDMIYFSRKMKTICKNNKRYSQEHLHVQVHMQS